MAVSQKRLLDEITSLFPTTRKPESYVDVIIAVDKLKAYDKESSKRRKHFGDLKNNAFSKCHKEMGLLEKFEDGDSSISPISDRDNVVFKFDYAQEVLNIEKKLLLKHIKDNSKVKEICIDVLKLPKSSSTTTIKQKMDDGNIFKQSSTYEKMFEALKKKRIPSTGYLKFRVRPIPVPTYYLSRKAQNILIKCKGGVNN